MMRRLLVLSVVVLVAGVVVSFAVAGALGTGRARPAGEVVFTRWEGVGSSSPSGLSVVLDGSRAGRQPPWTPRDVSLGGGDLSEVRAINDRGQMVGLVDYWNLYLSGTGDLGVVLECYEVDCDGGHFLNDRGQVVGTREGPSGRAVAFLWERGGLKGGRARDLEADGSAYARDVNEHGLIVGQSDGRAVVWQSGKVRRLAAPKDVSSGATAVNDRGEIVGWVGDRAALWRGRARVTLPTLGGDSGAVDVNERGQVVGWTTGRDGKPHGALWTNGRIRDLGTRFNDPWAVNNRGVIVGVCEASQRHACVLAGGKLTDLHASIRSVTKRSLLDRIEGSEAVDINDRNQIVGNVIGTTFSDKWWVVAVLWTKTG